MNIQIVVESNEQTAFGYPTIAQAIQRANDLDGTVRLSITDDDNTYDFYINPAYLDQYTEVQIPFLISKNAIRNQDTRQIASEIHEALSDGMDIDKAEEILNNLKS